VKYQIKPTNSFSAKLLHKHDGSQLLCGPKTHAYRDTFEPPVRDHPEII